MAWSNSKVFRQMVADILNNVATFKLVTDQITVALYNNTGTPDQNVTAANSAYNVAQWVTANEVFSAGQWAQGGKDLVTPVLDTSTNAVVMYDAVDLASGATATLASVFGCLVYENTLASPVANQGICFNYFGGSNSVTSGTFTVVWNVNGIFRSTM